MAIAARHLLRDLCADLVCLVVKKPSKKFATSLNPTRNTPFFLLCCL